MSIETMIDVILDNDAVEMDEFNELFNELFNNQGNRNYYRNTDCSNKYKEAIECLFDTELTIEERLENALNICGYCFEAYYFFKMLSDERNIYNYLDLFLSAVKDNNSFRLLPEYDNTAVMMILDDVSSFYMFRDNYKKAIAALHIAEEIDETTFNLNKIKLFICYERIEDYLSFKKQYDMGFVDDLVSYLLYICVLIKNLKNDEIAEVIMDMFHDYDDVYEIINAHFLNVEYQSDEETELAFEFAKTSIESIPNFYDILMDIIRKNNISPIVLEN